MKITRPSEVRLQESRSHEVRPSEVRLHDSRSHEGKHSETQLRESRVAEGRPHEAWVGEVPPIFPHLRPDLQYPDAGGSRLGEGGYYYDPRFGYVKAGSYYDQQIALMTGVAPDRLSRVSR